MPQSAAVVSRVRRSTSAALDAAGGEAVCQHVTDGRRPEAGPHRSAQLVSD